MSELKAGVIITPHDEGMSDGLEKAYAEIKYHKYKRCLDKAKLCKLQYDNFFKIHNIDHMQMGYGRTKRTLHRKWYKRWMELAEKFKETK